MQDKQAVQIGITLKGDMPENETMPLTADGTRDGDRIRRMQHVFLAKMDGDIEELDALAQVAKIKGEGPMGQLPCVRQCTLLMGAEAAKKIEHPPCILECHPNSLQHVLDLLPAGVPITVDRWEPIV
jgi:hypothetical protein